MREKKKKRKEVGLTLHSRPRRQNNPWSVNRARPFGGRSPNPLTSLYFLIFLFYFNPSNISSFFLNIYPSMSTINIFRIFIFIFIYLFFSKSYIIFFQSYLLFIYFFSKAILLFFIFFPKVYYYLISLLYQGAK